MSSQKVSMIEDCPHDDKEFPLEIREKEKCKESLQLERMVLRL